MPVERLEAGGEEHESAVLARQISEIGICALRVKKVFLCEKVARQVRAALAR